jgi:N,N-dimethylformamidase
VSVTEVVGYLDRWSARPGATVTVHLGSERPAVARLDLIRLGRGVERAEPDGIVFEPVTQVAPQTLQLVPQRVDAGSYAVIDDLAPAMLEQGGMALLVQPWCVEGDEQTVLALDLGGTLLRLLLDAEGRPGLQAGAAPVQGVHRVALRRWLALRLSWSGREAGLQVFDLELGLREDLSLQLDRPVGVARRLVLAGTPEADGQVGRHFDGRLERPLLWPLGGLPGDPREALCAASGLPTGAIAAWDLGPGPLPAASSHAFQADRVAADHPHDEPFADLGPLGLHGRLCQGPKRAVRGARWTGDEMDWRRSPSHYAAVHFHRDDLIDARWAPSARIALPPDLPSGAYAVRVRIDPADCGNLIADGVTSPADGACASTGGLCRLPLFVRTALPVPPDGKQPPAVALVFPTFTYLAYANDRCALHGHNPEVLADRLITLEPSEVLLSRHPEWGLSLYDTHQDGSGVSTSSRWRPLPTLHPDQRAWQAGEGSGRWNYPGDLLLVAWLEREGIAWQAVTDEDLEAEGPDALAGCRVVLTGNHPEYATPRMIDSYRAHLARGGRMMYLGGNGFYWRVAQHPGCAGVIELRRAEDGNRSWAEEPGEYYQASDGGYGGLWRRNGLTPQSWLGVGYAGQGFRRSTGFRRTPESSHPMWAFVFEGVEGEAFGLSGVIGGGCAGVEVDRHDVALGSPPWACRVATSLPFDATYLVANEELLVSRPTITAPFAPALRADVVLLPLPAGGAVFSTGSIAWVGGLAAQGGDGGVQRITLNVLNRLLLDAPLHADGLGPDDRSRPATAIAATGVGAAA